ncbi:MAG: hypothetical protein H6599_10215 [Flavobacteriales bacterium]|nr:hypothetical protein [Flavobacteriales bacterium]
MNRVLSIIFLVVGLSPVFANDGEHRKALEVQIVSDEFDKSIPEGKCKVTGEVYFQGELVASAEVCSFKGQECVKTNKKGEFSILIDTNESYVYATVIGAQTSYLQNYSFKSQHHLKIRFYVEQKYMTVKKPVLYIYSDEKVSMDLSLKTDVALTFTYPKYENGWTIEVDPQDGLSVNGKNYPYLFWEGRDFGNIKYSSEEEEIVGEVIKTDTVVSYLETVTKKMGLNSRESTDFITFWGPILSTHDFAFVQFALDEDYDQVAEIKSTVLIENERRIFMLYESFDQFPAINCTQSQADIPMFQRGGLTLIEWGGAEVNLPNL